jgi:hypothetical protein
VLTEAGVFCMLSLVVVLLSRLARAGITLGTMCLLGAALAAGYLFRATVLAVVPGVIVVIVVVCWRRLQHVNGIERRRLIATGLAGLFIVIALPFATVALWSSGGRVARVGAVFGYTLLYYQAAHGIIPLASHPLDDATAEYETARRATSGKWLALVPISHTVAERLHGAEGARLFWEVVVKTPAAYLAAVVRTGFVFVGVPQQGSENTLFISNALSLTAPGSKCICPEPEQAQFAVTFGRPGQRTPVHYLLKLLTPVYVPLVMIGWGCTLFAFGVGVRRADPVLLALTIVPVSFAGAHAVFLLGTDRFAMPAFPLALANLCVLSLSYVFSRTTREHPSGHPAPGALVEILP